MKIDEAMAGLKGKFTSGNSIQVTRSTITVEEWEALEQHHKDLMGLVEAWRIKERKNHGCGDFYDGIAHGYDMCSEQLESLINPKD